jgi:arginase
VSAVKTNVAWMYSRNRDKWHSWWGAIAPLELGRLRGTGGNRRHRRCILRLYSDLNTPAAADGALDWMALGHMLGVEGCEPALAETTGHGPLLEPSQVVLVAHSLSHSTRFERSEIERLRLAQIAREDVRRDPEDGARRALQLLAARSEHYIIHLGVDVVDFTDAPLSEHPSRNTGLKLAQMLHALKVLASGPGLAAITLAELNPHNAAAAEGLLERFAALFADAIRQRGE